MNRAIPFAVLLSVLTVEACVEPKSYREEMRRQELKKLDLPAPPVPPPPAVKAPVEPIRYLDDVEDDREELVQQVQETIIVVPVQRPRTKQARKGT